MVMNRIQIRMLFLKIISKEEKFSKNSLFLVGHGLLVLVMQDQI
jgi:hypothetical protein